MKTSTQMMERLKWYQNRAVDFDGFYGLQCMDLVVDFFYYMTGVRLWGNAKDIINNNVKNVAEIHTLNNADELQPGDILVYTLGFFDNQFGHTNIVFSNNNGKITVIEQNWDGLANKPATKRVDDLNGVSHYVRIKTTDKKEKSITQLANEVLKGKHGTGAARQKKLGSKYQQVQNEVNRILLNQKQKQNQLSYLSAAHDVIKGKYGNGSKRSKLLKQKGYDPVKVQNLVNDILSKK